MPSLRWLTLTLANVDADIVMSLFATSNSPRSVYVLATLDLNGLQIRMIS